jgi:hypothetical protein
LYELERACFFGQRDHVHRREHAQIKAAVGDRFDCSKALLEPKLPQGRSAGRFGTDSGALVAGVGNQLAALGV